MSVDLCDELLLAYIEELEASLKEGGRMRLPPLTDADALLRLRGLKTRKPGDLWTIAPDERCAEGVPALLLITKLTHDGALLARTASLELALATDEDLVLPAEATPAREPIVVFGEERYFRRGPLRAHLGSIDEEILSRINGFFDEPLDARGEDAPRTVQGIPLLELSASPDALSFYTGLPIEDEDDLRLDARSLFFEATRYLAPEYDAASYGGSLDRLLALRASDEKVMQLSLGDELLNAHRLFDFRSKMERGELAYAHRDASQTEEVETRKDAARPAVPIEARLGEIDLRCEIHSDGEHLNIHTAALRSSDGKPAPGLVARLEISVSGESLYDDERLTGPRGVIIPFAVKDNDLYDYRLRFRFGDDELVIEW